MCQKMGGSPLAFPDEKRTVCYDVTQKIVNVSCDHNIFWYSTG